MKLNKFLSILLYYNEEQVDSTPIICKFYAQPRSFSFELRYKYAGEQISKSGILHQSEVYYNWIENKSIRTQILNDIEKSLDLEEVQHKLLMQIYHHTLTKLKYNK